MEELFKLLFELSSSERVNIMLKLQKQDLRLSYLAKELDMTVTEASRHLQRLSEAKLVEKTEGFIQTYTVWEVDIILASKLRVYFKAQRLLYHPCHISFTSRVH